MSETSDASEGAESDQADKDKNEKATTNSFNPAENTWKIATLALTSVLFLLSLILILNPGMLTGAACEGGLKSSVTIDQASDKALDFINNNMIQSGSAAITNRTETSGVYFMNTSYRGQTIPIYVTKDGKYLFLQPINMEAAANQNEQQGQQDQNDQAEDQQEQTTSNKLPQSNKPKVELFVMSYCPFGTQMEKAILPVVELLGDKIDFKNKFVYYSMHGEKEIREQTREYCIQKNEPGQYVDYLNCFLKDSNWESCLESTNIDQTQLDECVQQTNEKYNVNELLNNKSSWLSGRFPLYKVHEEENEKYGVKGSPTLVVNGQTASAQRTPNSVLKTICSAFKQPPEECETELSSSAPSTGFGFSESGSSSGGSCG